MDSSVEESFTLLKKGTGKDLNSDERWCLDVESGARTNDASGAVTNLVVLALGELYEEFCDLMLDLHLTENGCAVVCDGDVSVWGDEDFVETCELDVIVIG